MVEYKRMLFPHHLPTPACMHTPAHTHTFFEHAQHITNRYPQHHVLTKPRDEQSSKPNSQRTKLSVYNADKLYKETKCQQPSTNLPELTIIRRLKFYSFFRNFCQL